MSCTLHPHQTRTLDLMRESYAKQRRHGSPIRTAVQAPTGFGKTVLMATTALNLIRNQVTPIGILVPRKQLIDQTVAQLETAGVRAFDIGVIQGDHPRVNRHAFVQVCTPQTLENRRAHPAFGFMMVDEIHEQFRWTREWMQRPEMAAVPFLGFSATPWSKGLGTYWHDLVIAATTAELIATVDPSTGKPFLSPLKVYAPPSGIRPNLSGIDTTAQVHGTDYVPGQLSTEMSKEPLVADAVETWKAMARDRATLTFCVDRAHADAVHRKFCDAGAAAEYLDGNTSMEDRRAVRERLRSAETEVVVNIGVLTTGCDWPEVSCIQMLRPTKSEMLLVQIVGRGLRPAAGKQDCLVLDHTTNTERLGLVTHIHHAELDDGKPNATAKAQPVEALPKECSSCHLMKPPRTRTCPQCGHEARIVSKVGTKPGVLVEIGSRKKPEPTIAEMQRWYSMLLGIAQKRDYKTGWVAHAFRRKFKTFPQNLSDNVLPANDGVRRYARHLLIAYAKSAKAQSREAA